MLQRILRLTCASENLHAEIPLLSKVACDKRGSMIYPLQLKGGHMYLGLPISCRGSEFGVG